MELREKVGQLVWGRFKSEWILPESSKMPMLLEQVGELGLGGFLVQSGNTTEIKFSLSAFALNRKNELPVMFCSDVEQGVGQWISGGVKFPRQLAFGACDDEELTEKCFEFIGKESLACGIGLPFIPILDVNNNPNNPIICTRSFGEDPNLVAKHGLAAVLGLKKSGALSCLKHFPGHGNTTQDSHNDLTTVPGDRNTLDKIELYPFKKVISEGEPDAVMIAHVSVPGIDSTGTPASLSKIVVTDLLVNELGFGGLIVTDALCMGGIKKYVSESEAAVMALEAGCHVLLLPDDPYRVVTDIIEAINDGKMSEDIIDAAYDKVVFYKKKVDRALSTTFGASKIAGENLSEQVAEKSIVKLGPDRCPAQAPEMVIVIDEDAVSPICNAFIDNFPETTGKKLLLGKDDVYSAIETLKDFQGEVVVAVFSEIKAFKGTSGISKETEEVLKLAATKDRPFFISFSSPYFLAPYKDQIPCVFAFSGCESSQKASAKALYNFGAGTMPVTL